MNINSIDFSKHKKELQEIIRQDEEIDLSIVKELEDIKAEIKKEAYQIINIDDEFFDLGFSIAYLDDIYGVIDKHISELKGE